MPQNITSTVRGILFPFRRDASDIANSNDIERLTNARIKYILCTKTGPNPGQGDLPWRSNFGSRLWLLRHDADPVVLNEVARSYVIDALRRWEPNIQVESVTVTNANDGVLEIAMTYSIRGVRNDVTGPQLGTNQVNVTINSTKMLKLANHGGRRLNFGSHCSAWSS
jgi:phage baseplate assembly protein W